MAAGIQKSGVQLVAEGYQQYLQQMRNVNKAHQEAFSNKHLEGYKQGQKKVREEADKTKKSTNNLRIAMQSLGSGDVLGAIQSLHKAFSKLQNVVAIFMAIKIVAKLVNFGKAAVEVAARNETLGVSLNEVAKQAGYTSEQVAWATEQLKDQGITTQASRQSLLQMAQANIEWTKASELARIAQSAAVIANTNSSEAFQRITTAIQRGEIELLKTIGINVSFANSYKTMAAQLGKTTGALTEQEKIQARTNAVVEAGAAIYGVYDEAMSTAGKQQGSLSRHIEETQANVGNLLLPLKSLSIELQTKFWKGARRATKSLGVLGEALGNARMRTKEFREEIGKETPWEKLWDEDFGSRLGRGIHSITRAMFDFAVMVAAAIRSITQSFDSLGGASAKFFNALSRGKFAEAGRAFDEIRDNSFDLTGAFQENFDKMHRAATEWWPDVYKSYDELGDVAETSLERTNNAIDDHISKLNEMKAALEQQMEVLEQVENIERNYRKAVDKAGESYAKRVAKLEKGLAKAREKAAEKVTKSLADLEKDAAKSRAKVLEESRREEVQAQQELYRDMEQERRRFELSQLQGLRRFKLSEKRLQAAGDILGLIQLREDFDLQKKEAKENQDLSQQEQKDAAQQQLREQREDVQERLQELETEINERRADIQQGYKDELNELVKSNQERRAEALASYQEQLQDLKDNRNEQLEELGRSLQKEAEITEAGMKEIAEKIGEVFGDQGAADAIMEGWAERSTTAVSMAMQDIANQIAAVDAQLSALESGDVATDSTSELTRRGRRGSGVRRGRRRGMRSGGVGEVIGPALFEVEPGVKERVAFAPVGASARNQLDVNVAGGFDVRGAEGASSGVVDAAVEQMLQDFSGAVRKLTKR